MKILDTRDLRDRLQELKDIQEARTDAEKAVDKAKETFKACCNDERLEATKALNEAEDELENTQELDDDEKQELKELEELEAEVSEWNDGNSLIPESEFTDYCKQMLEDCGDIPKHLPHYIVLDWDATANNIKADYSEITYQGENYLYRDC